MERLSKHDKKIYLMPFYNNIVDLAIAPCLKIRHGLTSNRKYVDTGFIKYIMLPHFCV